MKLRIFAAVLACLVAAVAHAQSGVDVPGFGAVEAAKADGIGLVGPATANAGDEITLRITGTPPLDLALPLIDQLGWLMGPDRMFCYVAAPGFGLVPLDVRGELVFGAAGATMQPLLRVTCQQAGEYRILVDWNTGQNQLVAHTVTVGGEPGPTPPDPPGPTPDPPPPDKLAEMWVVTVYDSATRTPGQFQSMAAPAVSTWISENGHHLCPTPIMAADESGKPPADRSPWIEEAKDKPLPHVFLVGPDGVAKWSGSLPESGAEFLRLLKQHGAEK